VHDGHAATAQLPDDVVFVETHGLDSIPLLPTARGRSGRIPGIGSRHRCDPAIRVARGIGALAIDNPIALYEGIESDLEARGKATRPGLLCWLGL
jgi:hypothetical protein